MIQGDETANNRLIVFKGEIRVGTLERNESGSLFQYDERYRTAHDNNERDHWISAHHPLPHAQFRTNGVNLSPFFAGLLPEGIRLKALKVALKKSEDDLFSMLTAVGKDVVGDVWVSILEQPVAEPTFEPVDLAKVSFHKLFEERLYDISKLNPAIAGVQDKISASMISFPLKVREKNKDYILKLQAKEQPNILEN